MLPPVLFCSCLFAIVSSLKDIFCAWMFRVFYASYLFHFVIALLALLVRWKIYSEPVQFISLDASHLFYFVLALLASLVRWKIHSEPVEFILLDVSHLFYFVLALLALLVRWKIYSEPVQVFWYKLLKDIYCYIESKTKVQWSPHFAGAYS